MSEALHSRSYIASMNDYSLFTKTSSASQVVLVVYVDDILLAGDDLVELESLKSFLDTQFKIKDLGTIYYFPALSVITPFDPFVKLVLDMGEPFSDPSLYGRYLLNDPAQVILLSGSSDFSLQAYSDFDWAACSISCKSVTDYYITLGGSPVSWKSKKQPTIFYLQLRLLVPIFCESQAALHISKNPVFHERTKHIEIDCHYVRTCLNSGLIPLHFVSRAQQLDDIMTKALSGPLHHGILCKLAVRSSGWSRLEEFWPAAFLVDGMVEGGGGSMEILV
ncbi:PREDICTED: uncharacterized protein LOC109233693 [Nicotiana attenuata]|uniref:uncharacterized protein LOC109233693 n=1 Tax=Nicotiana attenuata TaxID=49451 RepID=UPI0009046FC5|nr:PREDICTED: uncharacterized protein LOC109233693 [Nicotiana attenuata]